MVTSMTGYGRGEATARGITATVELRSVNSRFLEVSSRLPRTLNLRENEIKEILRRQVVRGKISVVVTVRAKQRRSRSSADQSGDGADVLPSAHGFEESAQAAGDH